MKFSPLIELNRWAAKRESYLTSWHRHFAWWPTNVGDNDWRWLEVIERKLEFVGAYDGIYTFAYYRLAQ